MFKKFRMWFCNKNRLIDELIKVSRIIELHNKNLLSKLEELDQEKVYVCKMPGVSQKELNRAKDAFIEASKSMRWTMPNILFIKNELVLKKQRSVNKK